MISIVRNVIGCITSTLPVVTQSMIKPTLNGNRFVSTILCGLHRQPIVGIGNHVLSTDRACSPPLLQSTVPRWTQVAGFKVKGRLKRRCKDCYFVMRQQRLYVICKTHPRHKQMSMKPKDSKSWILTHATQSKVRPY